MEDTRNVVDKYKGWEHDKIVADLDKSRLKLHVAVENLVHDFNIGTVIRNANAFNVAGMHVIGRKHYNRRGAMCTDKYLKMYHWASVGEFVEFCRGEGLVIFAIDNVSGAEELSKVELPEKVVFVYGGERGGVSAEMIEASEKVVAVEQLGSTRSVNVGVASGITMYEYVRRHALRKPL